MRTLRLATRGLATKAAAVKALAAEQMALKEAVSALGASPPFSKVKELTESEPYASTVAKVKEAELSWTWTMMGSKPEGEATTIAVTGAGSAAGAAALYRIAAGEMLGSTVPVKLQLSGADAALVGDLEACGFPLLKGVTAASSPTGAVSGAKIAVLLDGDFAALGSAIASGAKGCVVGVDGCTNALATSKAAGGAATVTAITSGPQVAMQYELATASGVSPSAVDNVVAWGDGIVDISHAKVAGKWALKLMDTAMPTPTLTPTIEADAIVGHMKSLVSGSDGKWISMGVPAMGDYGLGEGYFFSVPVECANGAYKRVGGVTMTAEVAAALEKSRGELQAAAAKL